MHNRHLLFWIAPLLACAFLLWLLLSTLLRFAAALALLRLPARFLILLARLLVAFMAARDSALMARGHVAPVQQLRPGNPGPDWLRDLLNEGVPTDKRLARGATYLTTLLSSIWSAGTVLVWVRVIAVPIRLAGSRYMASPVYQGEASG